MSRLIKFSVEGRIYEIPDQDIPSGSLLRGLIDNSSSVSAPSKKDGDALVLDITTEEFLALKSYLVDGLIPSDEMLPVFDYYNLDPWSDYDHMCRPEENMRAKMYQSDYADHPMNTDPHYQLIKITEQLWTELKLFSPEGNDLLFTHSELQKRTWNEVQKSLTALTPLMKPGMLVAGGRVFSALFGTRSGDVDLFLHGMTTERAEETILDLIKELTSNQIEATKIREELNVLKNNPPHEVEQIHKKLKDLNRAKRECRSDEDYERLLDLHNEPAMVSFNQKTEKLIERLKELSQEIVVTRTQGAFTITVDKNDYQVVLRLYKSLSEVLHGFDVDCCSLGWDGQDLWMTRRAFFAIRNGYNTVNFNRLSPSYEWRLMKYGTRGVAVKVPQFDRTKVNTVEMAARWKRIRDAHLYGDGCSHGNMSTRYKNVKGQQLHHARTAEKPLRGLDVLLYMEYHCTQYKYGSRMLTTVEKLAKESSDYDPVPYTDYKRQGTNLSELIDFLLESGEESHPEAHAKYCDLLDHSVSHFGEYFTVNSLRSRSWDFIGYYPHSEFTVEAVHELMHLPGNLYTGMAVVHPWKLPQNIQFKTTEPGAQMTNTFTVLVLDNTDTWYNGLYYTR